MSLYIFFFVLITSASGLINHNSNKRVNIPIASRTTNNYFFGQQRISPINSINEKSILILQGKLNNNNDNDNNVNPLTKSTWYAAEVFGKVVGLLNKSKDTKPNDTTTTSVMVSKIDMSIPPQSIEETFERIKLDNDRQYFLSGQVDKLIYDIDCTFSDPFVSFNGRDRFVENLANLGSVITKYNAKVLQYNESLQSSSSSSSSSLDNKKNDNDTAEVSSKFMVKLELNLPWRPVLAWPWGVRCVIDRSTKLVILHEESWDIDPWEGVKQIFRKPTTQV